MNKTIRSMVFLAALLCLVPMGASLADDVELSLAADKNGFCPGEPLVFRLIAARKAGDAIYWRMLFESIDIEVRDAGGRVVSEPRPMPPEFIQSRCRNTVDLLMFQCEFGEPGESLVPDYWCTTELQPGGYVFVFRTKLISYGKESMGPQLHNVPYSTPLELSLPFTVLERDDAKVNEVFEKLMQTVCSNADPRYEKPYKHKSQAVKAIMYATSKLAVPYQMRVLVEDWPDKVDYLEDAYVVEYGFFRIANPDVDTAKGLLDIVAKYDKGCRVLWADRIRWILYALRESGDPEIVTLTDQFAATHSKGRKPSVVEFMDGRLTSPRLP